MNINDANKKETMTIRRMQKAKDNLELFCLVTVFCFSILAVAPS
jgi:hypothetical protein